MSRKWRLDESQKEMFSGRSRDGKNDKLFSDNDPDRTLEDGPSVAPRQGSQKNR